MNEKKPINKRLIITISIVVIAIMACGIATFYLIKAITGDSPSSVVSEEAKTSQRAELVKKGISSEDKGDTQAALKSYQEARQLCAEADEECKNDMDAKVDMMNMYLKTKKDPEEKPRTNPDVLSSE